MSPSLLLQKLIEIEKSIGIDTDSTLRRKVLDAQDYVLRMHEEQLPAGRLPATQGTPARFALLRAFALRKADAEGE